MYTAAHPPCRAASPRLYQLRESRAYTPEELEKLLCASPGAQAADPLADPFAGLFQTAEDKPEAATHVSESLLGDVNFAVIEKLCSDSPAHYAVIRKDAYDFVRASSDNSSNNLQPVMAVIPPRSSAELTLSAHSGQEFLQLVEGRLEVSLHDKVEVLNPGDSIYFDSRIPHALRGLDDGNAISIAIIII